MKSLTAPQKETKVNAVVPLSKDALRIADVIARGEARISDILAKAERFKSKRRVALREIEKNNAAGDFTNLKSLQMEEQFMESEWNRFKCSAEMEEHNLRGPRADLAARLAFDAQTRELQGRSNG